MDLQERDIQGRSAKSAALAAVTLVGATVTCFLWGGGVISTLTSDTHIPSQPFSFVTLYACGVAVLAGAVALVCMFILVRQRNRAPLWSAVTLMMGMAIAVLGGEALLRISTPAWPARALHGVTPSTWATAIWPDQPASVAKLNLNSWGERDRERTRYPRSGMRRVAFIGDSFLEEGTNFPISLATESKIGQSQVEVINLGVSATGPDEYFERLRGVALPLGAGYCYLFIFAGNDFVSPARTLSSYWGIASVEPRRSLLTTLGLAGWNYKLTNQARPVMQAWLQGPSLAKDEQSRSLMVSHATDDELRSMLLGASGTAAAAYERLSEKLHSERMVPVFEMLRNPDERKFRSYYLSAALSAAADDNWQWPRNSEQIAWEWTECADRLCRSRGIELTVVIIPEAFQIDDRMHEQWLPLADMRKVTRPCRAAAARYAQRARAANLDVIDLHDKLQGVRGTYLNLDGHWSAAGVEMVSDLLAKHWLERGSAAGLAAHGQ